MKYPCLVLKAACRTQAAVSVEQEGVDKYGDPLETVEASALCNWQDTAQTVLTAEKKLIQLSGVALFRGDLIPSLPEITGGYITILGEKRRIYKGSKCRNPDGTVNYTKIEVV